MRTRSGNRSQYAAPGNVYQTADGKWASIAASTQSIFERLCTALNLRDLLEDERFATNPAQPVSELMTHENLATVSIGVGQEEARRLLHARRIEKLLVVDDAYRCVGLITVQALEKARAFPASCKDAKGRLRVAAATGVGTAGFERAERLLDAEVDVIVVDTAHGHSEGVLTTVGVVAEILLFLRLPAGHGVIVNPGFEAQIILPPEGMAALKQDLAIAGGNEARARIGDRARRERHVGDRVGDLVPEPGEVPGEGPVVVARADFDAVQFFRRQPGIGQREIVADAKAAEQFVERGRAEAVAERAPEGKPVGHFIASADLAAEDAARTVVEMLEAPRRGDEET